MAAHIIWPTTEGQRVCLHRMYLRVTDRCTHKEWFRSLRSHPRRSIGSSLANREVALRL